MHAMSHGLTADSLSASCVHQHLVASMLGSLEYPRSTPAALASLGHCAMQLRSPLAGASACCALQHCAGKAESWTQAGSGACRPVRAASGGAHCSSEHAPEHVIPALVARPGPVCDGKAERADVVCHHPVGHVLVAHVICSHLHPALCIAAAAHTPLSFLRTWSLIAAPAVLATTTSMPGHCWLSWHLTWLSRPDDPARLRQYLPWI